MRSRMLRPLAFFGVGSLLALGCGGSISGGDGGNNDGGGNDSGTVPDGGECVPGATRKLDCNTCFCQGDGHWACTGIACIDGGPPGPLPVSDPGLVTCAGAPCKVPGNYCCNTGLTPMPSAQKCVPDITSACGGLRVMCDESADCTNGDVCCVPPNANIRIALNAQCSPKGSCKDPTYFPQLCKTNAECDNGQPCVSQICLGALVWSCGGVDPKRCQ